MFESNEAVASVVPDGDHATARTVFAWPVGTVVMCVNLSGVSEEVEVEVRMLILECMSLGMSWWWWRVSERQ